MFDQPLEPPQLVIEFRTWRRISVRQIQASDQDAVDGRLDVPAMAVIWIAGQTASCLDRFGAAGENGDAVPAFLAVPDGPVAGLADRRLGKFLLRCLEFL